jgi:protein O-mannosyl-transferase
MQIAQMLPNNPKALEGSGAVIARPRLPGWLIALALALVTAALYWPATGHGFVDLDDQLYVSRNPHVKGGLNGQNILWAFSNLEAGFWHPVTWLSIMADCQLYDLRPWGHHLTSLLLHALSTAVLFLALKRMTGTTWRSAFVAALFGLHPLHVESVAWAAERKDVLSGLFWMLSLWGYSRYVECRRHKAEGRSRDSKADHRPSVPSNTRRVSRFTFHVSLFYLLSLLFFALGLMSKPMVVTLPVILLLLDWWPLQRFSWDDSKGRWTTVARLIWEKVPFLAAGLVFGVLTIYAEHGVGALGAESRVLLVGRLQNACLSYAAYLRQTFWPMDLAVFYPYPKVLPAGLAAGAGVLGLMISALVLVKARKAPYLAVGWAWYVVTLLPVIGLIPIGEFSRADRFTYVPLIGVFLMLAWGACELTRGWRHQASVLAAAGCAVIGLCFVSARQQLGYWKDSEALFRHALAVTVDNYMAQNCLGSSLDQKGQLDDAIPHYEEATRLQPASAQVHYNLGIALSRKGRLNEAIRQYQEAVRLQPGSTRARNNLGVLLAMTGQLDAAISQFQEVLRLKPDNADARNNLARAMASRKAAEAR